MSIMEDQQMVACILTRLSSPQDRLSASLVCKLWNEALALTLTHLPIRSRRLLPRLLQRFSNIQELDLRRCCDALQDADLAEAAPFLHGIKSLRIGNVDNPLVELSDVGFVSLACQCPLLERFAASSIPRLSDQAIIFLVERCPRLLAFSFENCPQLGDMALEAIARCRNLEEVTLTGKSNFTSQGLELICKRSLRRVHLQLGDVEVEHALKRMAHMCGQIQEVSIRNVDLDLRDVKFTTLTSLRLKAYQCIGLNEVITDMVAANMHLRELVINLGGFNDEDALPIIAVLKACHELEKLHIDSTQLTASLLNAILAHKSLQSLTLSFIRGSLLHDVRRVIPRILDLKCVSLIFMEELQDEELQLLLECTHHRLECISVHFCRTITSIGISAIGKCSNLQSLDLCLSAVDDFSFKIIANGINKLTRLNLMGSRAISKFEIVARFSFLEYLQLDKCQSVSDRVLGIIAGGCRQLAQVSLLSTGITDNGLHHLVQCGQLQRLRIAHCAKLFAGSGLFSVANACGWLYYLMISPHSIDAKILQELNHKFFLHVNLSPKPVYEFF